MPFTAIHHSPLARAVQTADVVAAHIPQVPRHACDFVIGWFVRHTLDAPVWRWIGLNQANGAITIVQWESDRPATLVSFNDTGHL